MKKIISTALAILMLASVIVFTPSVSADAVSFDEMVSAAAEIIRSNEGYYHSVRADDNGALSIGWIQWHGNRALNLLKTIISADTATAKKLLGDALYKEATTSNDWSTRVLSSDEAEKVSALIDTPAGHKAQDELAKDNISSYINHGINLGITSPSALVFFADVENQCGGGGSARVASAAMNVAGSYGKITLENLYEASLEDPAAKKSAARRSSTYSRCVLLGWSEISTDYEIWKAETTSVNIRSGPGTEYELVSKLYVPNSIDISEKHFVNGALWGMSHIGWICLDYCTYRTGTVPSPAVFDFSGGYVADAVSALSVDGINMGRGAEKLIVYDNKYTSSIVQTNEYGAEAVVGSDGRVIKDPVYGSCKSQIPKGGFVISGHGGRAYEICSKLKAGSYVHFNDVTMTLDVFDDRSAYTAASKTVEAGKKIGELPTPEKDEMLFAGWYTSPTGGEKITDQSVCQTHGALYLYARYTSETPITFVLDGGKYDNITEKEITGVNTSRDAETLILYNSEYGSSTGTNIYGAEAIVNADGSVTEKPYWGQRDSVIPEGGFVLSGHNTMGAWICQSIDAGNYVSYNAETESITVYKDKYTYDSLVKNIKRDNPIGVLPAVSRDGYYFAGWFDENGVRADENTVVSSGGIVLIAKWKTYDTCGDDLKWSIENGKLTFEGSGAIYDWSVPGRDTAPWTKVGSASDMITVELSEKITAVGNNSFLNCNNLKTVILTSETKAIGTNAFKECTSLKYVYFVGSEEDWKNINIADGNESLENARIYYNCIPGYLPGDVNGDGVVNSEDSALALSIILGKYEPREDEALRADVFRDGVINTRDSYLIKQIIEENRE